MAVADIYKAVNKGLRPIKDDVDYIKHRTDEIVDRLDRLSARLKALEELAKER